MDCLTNHLYRESKNLFDLPLVDQKAVTVITLDAHLYNKKKCQNKNFVEVNETRFHLYKTVLSLIILCGTCMVRQKNLYMGMRHYIM